MRHIFRVASLAGCILLAVSLVTTANADRLEDFWGQVNGTMVGEQEVGTGIDQINTIRVVFVTSAAIDAESPDWGDYDFFGDNRASAPGTITAGLGASEWQPLVSTAVTPDHSSGSPVEEWLESYSSAPVFNTNGQLMGSNGAAMLSGLAGYGIRYDESGDDQLGGGSLAVWTGTNREGDPAVFTRPDDPLPIITSHATLGSVNDGQGGFWDKVAVIGDGADGGTDWLASSVVERDPEESVIDENGNLVEVTNAPIKNSIYVMSGEVTVVPEPSTVLLWLGCSGLAGLIYWRKRRRS